MFENLSSILLLTSVLITTKLLPQSNLYGKVLNGYPPCLIRLNAIKLAPSLQLILTLQCTRPKKKGPVCREKLVLVYLCALLLAESYAPESNPGPRPPKFPCGICQKAVKWSTPGVQCDSCKLWYQQDCMGMGDHIYFALKNVSWECFNCGLPNFSSSIFDLTLFETSNQFEPLSADNSKSSELEFSFNSP